MNIGYEHQIFQDASKIFKKDYELFVVGHSVMSMLCAPLATLFQNSGHLLKQVKKRKEKEMIK